MKKFVGAVLALMVINCTFAVCESTSQPVIISATMRADDPTIMDVVYKVISTNATVKVRMLAFENGERTFPKCVRPETFVEGTESNLGDAITANAEHKVSWKVSADYASELAKLKVEMLVSDGDLLPLDLVDIPSNGTHSAMTVSCNTLTEAQFYNALLWLWADKTEGMWLDGCCLKAGDVFLACSGQCCGTRWHYSDDYSQQYRRMDAVPYVFSKMGYQVLENDTLDYVNDVTRLGLAPGYVSSLGGNYGQAERQYAYKLK